MRRLEARPVRTPSVTTVTAAPRHVFCNSGAPGRVLGVDPALVETEPGKELR